MAAPKQKFSFKSRRTPALMAVESKPETKKVVPLDEEYMRQPTISDLTDEHYIHHPENSNEFTSVSIRNCHNALIDLRQCRISALHVHGISGCILLCNPISASVLISNANNSIVMVGCHQFRMHDSVCVDVYLYVTSDPIIEDCHDIEVGDYPEVDRELFEVANLNANINLYDQMKDFNWLKAGQSENWSLKPAGYRLQEGTFFYTDKVKLCDEYMYRM